LLARAAFYALQNKMVAAKKKRQDNQDMWGIIDEVEERYTDLIDELEGDDPRQHRHPKMKVSGMSVREIPRLQEGRREKKGKGKK